MVNLDSYAPQLDLSRFLSYTQAHTNECTQINLKPLIPHKDKTRFLFIKQRWQVLNKLFSGTVCLCVPVFIGDCLRACVCLFLYNNARVCIYMLVCVFRLSKMHSFLHKMCLCWPIFVSICVGVKTIGACGYELSLISRRPVLSKQSWHGAAPTSYLSLGIRN